MGALTYTLIRAIGYPCLAVSSKAIMLHGERIRRKGAFIIAPNHCSPYDIPALMRASSRDLDFLSIVEFYKHPWVSRLFRGMNCIFVNRAKADAMAARQIIDRLSAGRVVVMFPEAQIRPEAESVLAGEPFRPGVVKVAQVAGVPIIPCAIVDTDKYKSPRAWAPLRLTRYGIAFGEPIHFPEDGDAASQRYRAAEQLKQAYLALYDELCTAMQRPKVRDTRDRRAPHSRITPEPQRENCTPT